MISTLTVSGSIQTSGSITVNQLAGKNNLVVHLDASTATYTGYVFNSGSNNGTPTTVLNWPNRWTDLSGNGNHAYPIRSSTGTSNGINYISSGLPFTSSYLTTNVTIPQGSLFNTINDRCMRFNPINEAVNRSYSVFVWINFSKNNSASQYSYVQPIISKRTLSTEFIWDFGAPGGNNNGPFRPQATIWSGSTPVSITAPAASSVVTGSWAQLGFTVDAGSQGSGFRLYLNGVQVGYDNLSTINYIPTTGSRQILMGHLDWQSNNIRSNFGLSQVMIFNKSLTPREVLNNYHITKYKHTS
jgi:hypothetical protein